jgi:PQQ-like domain
MGSARHPVVALVFLVVVTTATLVVPAAAQRGSPRAGGDQLWVSRFDNRGGIDSARDLAVSPDGSKVFVTGYSSTPSYGDTEYATVAYDAVTGGQLWARAYNGPAHLSDEAFAVAVSADGSEVFVTGESGGVGTEDDFATVAYAAATGAKLWTARYDGPAHGYDAGVDVATSPDGSAVFVIGQSETADGAYATIAYNQETGATLWAQSEPPCPTTCQFSPEALTVSMAGNTLYATGYSASLTGSGSDFYTVAFDTSAGAINWGQRTIIGDRLNTAYYIALSPDGSKVFVGGHSVSLGDCCNNGITIAYDAATGLELWNRRFSKRQFYWDANVTGLTLSPGGSKVYIVGTTEKDLFTPDSWALAYDANTGRTMWNTRVAGRYASSIVASPDRSKVFIGDAPLGQQFSTVAFDATTGAIVWQAQDTSGYSGGKVLVSPDGLTLFLSTDIEDPPGVTDFETIAYST